MVRVGFVYAFSEASWFGGLSYFRNLLNSVLSLPERRIEPVLIVQPGADLGLAKDWPPLEKIRSRSLQRYRPEWVLRKAYQYAFSRDLLYERFLANHDIALVSHSCPLGENARLPSLGWIPDFQYRHLPHFFDDEQRESRDREVRETCALCTNVLLSSETARADLAVLDPGAAARSKVLRFVALPNVRAAGRDLLQERYGFRGPFFHLPNQFWIHKNHGVVVEALRILKSRGREVLVLATGNAEDHRQPGYFAELMSRVDEAGVRENFKVLGMVDRAELYGLMSHSVALINPSLFEGWSTTVEEAKSLGKRIILSDLAVHREQAPPRGAYFDPEDPEALADTMWELWSDHDEAADERTMQRAREDLPARQREFALDYQNIVMEVLK